VTPVVRTSKQEVTITVKQPLASRQAFPRPPSGTGRRRVRILNARLAAAIILGVVGIIGLILALPALSSPPAPVAPTILRAPAPDEPMTIEFIVSGYAPSDRYGDKTVIEYGSDLDTRGADPAQINGTVTYKVPFNGAAQYYQIIVWLAMAGHVTCTVVVTGPDPDLPATASTGSASGELATCAARAGPGSDGWATWRDEKDQVLRPGAGILAVAVRVAGNE
jgi:hypothetical protein